MHAAIHGHAATAIQSAGARNDLEFVAQLLGDPTGLHSGLNAPSSIPRARRHKAAKKRSLATSREANIAEPSDEAKTLLTRYNTPIRKPDSMRYICEACSCSVSSRGNDWDIHVAGAKHQRQLVSLLHTGQLGNTIVSVFEAEPGAARLAYFYSGTDRCFGSACACFAVAGPSTNDFPQSSAEYSHLDKTRLHDASTQVLKGLLNLGGKSVYTKRIARHYTDASLCQAWISAAAAMAAQADFGSVWHLALAANQLVCASQMLHEYGPIRSLTVISLCGQGAARAESEDQTQAWKCMEDSIAISMLVKACQSLHTLESLIIRFTHVGTCHQTVFNQVPRKDPFQDISRIYGPVWFNLQGLLTNSLSLRGVNIALSCQYPWNVSMSKLKAAAAVGHQIRTTQLKTAVLMGTHSRLGAKSHVRHLPVSMVHHILTLALPQESCKVWVSTDHNSWTEA